MPRCSTKDCCLYPFSADALKITLVHYPVERYIYTYVINSETGRWGCCLVTQYELVYLVLFFFFPCSLFSTSYSKGKKKMVLHQNGFYMFLHSKILVIVDLCDVVIPIFQLDHRFSGQKIFHLL